MHLVCDLRLFLREFLFHLFFPSPQQATGVCVCQRRRWRVRLCLLHLQFSFSFLALTATLANTPNRVVSTQRWANLSTKVATLPLVRTRYMKNFAACIGPLQKMSSKPSLSKIKPYVMRHCFH
jgi:hypothetical protein